MDPKLLLVKIVTLLYKESMLKEMTSQSTSIVKSVLGTIKFPETGVDFDHSREVLQALRATALWMCENPPDHVYDRATLLQRIRVNVGDDEGLYYAFHHGIDEDADPDNLKRQVLMARAELKEFLTRNEVKELIKKYNHQIMFREDTVNWKTLAREIHAELEPYTSGITMEKLEGMIEEIDMANYDSVEDLMTRAKAETAAEGTLKLGWQGWNRSTGEHNGLRRGEFITIGALQHNFKSGCTLNIFKQVALYNTPWMRDPTKKPCLVHISVENELNQNVLWLYANLKENETGEECDLSNVDVAEATRYVHERLSATGYHIKMCRFNPTDMTYHTFFDFINRLEAEGYEVHLVVFDYLNMISKKGCNQGPTGADTRDLFRRVRNFTSEKAITFITPAQLSTEAKGLVRQGVENFVQEIANKGYYDSCRTIDQEVDLEYYIHIVKINGQSFLTVQRGKHRKIKPTAEKHLYFVLPFSPVGGVRDDINGPDSTRKHAGGGVIGSGDERPWWESGGAKPEQQAA